MIAVALLGSTAAVSPTLHCQRSVPVMGVEVSEVRRWPWPRLSDSPSLSSLVWQRSLPWSPRHILSFKIASVLQACSGCFIIRAEVGNPFLFREKPVSSKLCWKVCDDCLVQIIVRHLLVESAKTETRLMSGMRNFSLSRCLRRRRSPGTWHYQVPAGGRSPSLVVSAVP